MVKGTDQLYNQLVITVNTVIPIITTISPATLL